MNFSSLQYICVIIKTCQVSLNFPRLFKVIKSFNSFSLKNEINFTFQAQRSRELELDNFVIRTPVNNASKNSKRDANGCESKYALISQNMEFGNK